MMGEESIRKTPSYALLVVSVILISRIHIQSIQESMCLTEWLNLNVGKCLGVPHCLLIVSLCKAQQEAWDQMELWGPQKELMPPPSNIRLSMLMKQ